MSLRNIVTSISILTILFLIALQLSPREEQIIPSIGSVGATTTILSNVPRSISPKQENRKFYEDNEYGFSFTYASYLTSGKASWEGVPLDYIYLFGDNGYGTHSFKVIPGDRNDSTINKEAESLEDYMKPYVSKEKHGNIVIRRRIAIFNQEKLTINGLPALKQRYSAHLINEAGEIVDPTIEGTISGNIRYVFHDGKDRFVILDTYDPAFDLTQDPEIMKKGMREISISSSTRKIADLALREFDFIASSFKFK